MGLFDWLKPKPRFEPLTGWAPTVTPQWAPDAPLFIANRQEGIGIVQTSEIAYGKATGRRYIKLMVDFGAGDIVMCHLSRIAYTNVVLKYRLSPDSTEEELNVAWLKGAKVKVRWEHKVYIDDQVYVTAYIKDVL